MLRSRRYAWATWSLSLIGAATFAIALNSCSSSKHSEEGDAESEDAVAELAEGDEGAKTDAVADGESADSRTEGGETAAATPAASDADPTAPTSLAGSGESVPAAPDVSLDGAASTAEVAGEEAAKPARVARQRASVGGASGARSGGGALKRKPFKDGEDVLNAMYFARENAESWQSVAETIYGSTERAAKLQGWNGGRAKPGVGKPVYYSSVQRPGDETQMKVYFDDIGIPLERVQVKRGDTLGMIAQRVYGSSKLSAEIRAANPDVAEWGKLEPGTELRVQPGVQARQARAQQEAQLQQQQAQAQAQALAAQQAAQAQAQAQAAAAASAPAEVPAAEPAAVQASLPAASDPISAMLPPVLRTPVDLAGGRPLWIVAALGFAGLAGLGMVASKIKTAIAARRMMS